MTLSCKDKRIGPINHERLGLMARAGDGDFDLKRDRASNQVVLCDRYQCGIRRRESQIEFRDGRHLASVDPSRDIHPPAFMFLLENVSPASIVVLYLDAKKLNIGRLHQLYRPNQDRVAVPVHDLEACGVGIVDPSFPGIMHVCSRHGVTNDELGLAARFADLCSHEGNGDDGADEGSPTAQGAYPCLEANNGLAFGWTDIGKVKVARQQDNPCQNYTVDVKDDRIPKSTHERRHSTREPTFARAACA